MAEIAVTITIDGVVTTRQISKKSFVIGSDDRADLVVSGDGEVRGEHLRVIVRRADSAIIVRPIAEPITSTASR